MTNAQWDKLIELNIMVYALMLSLLNAYFVFVFTFYWVSASFVSCSMLTLGPRLPLEDVGCSPVSCSRACRSSLVRVLERIGRKGAGEPEREARN
jgi:hypothetical protein